MSPQLSWINLGGTPPSSFSSTSMSSSDSWMKSLQPRNPSPIPLGQCFFKLLSITSLDLRCLRPWRSSLASPPTPLDLPCGMTATSPCSRMLASDMMTVRNLGSLQCLELPTNMTCLQTHMSTSIPRITLPQASPMVELTCLLMNCTMSILPTSIDLLLSPPLPLGNLSLPWLLQDPTPEGLLVPSTFLLTFTTSE